MRALQRWLVILAAAALAGAARAESLTDWSARDVIRRTDPTDGAVDDSRDVTNLLYRFHAGTHFFRMDLRGAPQDGTGQSAPDYMLQMDALAGGANAGNGAGNTALSLYVAQGLSGIDLIVDAHRQAGGEALNEQHVYSPGATPPYNFTTILLQDLGGAYQQAGNDGRTLEWAVPMDALPYWPLKVYASAQNIAGGQTFDITGAVKIPPLVRITAFDPGGSNVWLTVTGTNSWVPRPVSATNLLEGEAWTRAETFGSTYPAISAGTFRVSMRAVTNGPDRQCVFYRIAVTNANP